MLDPREHYVKRLTKTSCRMETSTSFPHKRTFRDNQFLTAGGALDHEIVGSFLRVSDVITK